MNKLIYLKVFVLVVALGAVVYVITHMSPDKVAQSMSQVGLAPAPAVAPPSSAPLPGTAGVVAAATETINLCKTRVHAIVWPDGRKIQEARDGMKARWQAYNLNPEDIGSMDVEKWLSLHCEVAANEHPGAAAFAPYVTFEYIDGSHEALERSADGVYRFAGRTFASPALDQAFKDLIQLANLQPMGP